MQGELAAAGTLLSICVSVMGCASGEDFDSSLPRHTPYDELSADERELFCEEAVQWHQQRLSPQEYERWFCGTEAYSTEACSEDSQRDYESCLGMWTFSVQCQLDRECAASVTHLERCIDVLVAAGERWSQFECNDGELSLPGKAVDTAPCDTLPEDCWPPLATATEPTD